MPSPARVIQLIEAFRGSKTMFAAVALGVFDHLRDAPRDASELAIAIGANAPALQRLLDACVALRLLKKVAPARYANTPVASVYLTRDSPQTLVGYILYSDDVLWRLWGGLEAAVREGSNRWADAFGTAAPLFSQLFRTPEAMQTFIRGMHGFGLISSPAVVAAFDLSRYRHLVDLGGATGHLALAACHAYPRMSAVVFDLLPVVEFARALDVPQYRNARRRVEFIAGDFFGDELPEADLYALGRILHDWPDDKIRRLLTKIYQRLPPGGALLLAEKLVREDGSGPRSALLQSLNMLVATEGRERTLGEYTRLLEAAGFSRVEGKWTGAPLDAVLAAK